jgi:hypothetical protein
MPVYKSHALKVGSNWIGGILKQNLSSKATVNASPTAGSIYPLQITINEVKSMFGFTTYNISTALGILGLTGVALGGGTTAELYEIQWTDGGQIASGSVHRKIVLAAGRVIPRKLSASNRQDATLDLEALGLSADGAASPLAITENVALPTALDDARFTLHSASAAGIDMGCLQSLDFDFGLQIETAGCKSNIYDTRIEINSIVPKININTLDANLFGTGGSQIPDKGKICLHSDTIFKLRKRKPKVAEFVADATTEHVKITCDGVIVPSDPFSGSNNDNGTTTFEITGSFDGTNLPFVINSASALT